MTKTGPRPLSLHDSLHAALRARREEISHAATLGRRAEVLEDICVQLLHEFEGIVPGLGRLAPHRPRPGSDPPMRLSRPIITRDGRPGLC